MTATAEPSTAQPAAGIEDQPTVLASPEEFAGRLVESAVGAFDMFSIYVGEQLGLYRCLHEQGPATSIELAARTCMDDEPATQLANGIPQRLWPGVVIVRRRHAHRAG